MPFEKKKSALGCCVWHGGIAVTVIGVEVITTGSPIVKCPRRVCFEVKAGRHGTTYFMPCCDPMASSFTDAVNQCQMAQSA